jgi:hypothetical protein
MYCPLELEEEAAQAAADAARAERETLEPPAPREVPVLWRREPAPRGQVLPLPPRPPRRP